MVPTRTRRLEPGALPSLLLTEVRTCVPALLRTSLLALLLAAQARAQPITTPRPDPLDPKAPVPAVRYESAFAQSRRIGDDKPVGWREANDTAARIGGWRFYAREAQQPEPAAAEKPMAPAHAPASAPTSAPAPASKPAPPVHSGHMHRGRHDAP